MKVIKIIDTFTEKYASKTLLVFGFIYLIISIASLVAVALGKAEFESRSTVFASLWCFALSDKYRCMNRIKELENQIENK